MPWINVIKDGDVVGHILSKFLLRDLNKAFAEVTGSCINRGAGYGLEVPCIYCFMDLNNKDLPTHSYSQCWGLE